MVIPASSPPVQMHGIVVLNKPSGMSSAECLRVLKKQGQKKLGHAGTLDPMASGVLPVLLGQATKLATWLQKGGQKTYSGCIRLGVETDTWDMEGQIVAERPYVAIAPDSIREAVAEWRAATWQEVPAFSAAKHNGQPLYKLARQGKPVPTKIKAVQIYESGVLTIRMPLVYFRVVCSSGTYIRSLAHSLGTRLGCGAALQSLLRESCYPFDLKASFTLVELEAGVKSEHVLPYTKAFPDWPCISLTAAQGKLVRNGRPLPAPPDAEGMAFLCHDKEVLAVAEATGEPKRWVISRGLWNF